MSDRPADPVDQFKPTRTAQEFVTVTPAPTSLHPCLWAWRLPAVMCERDHFVKDTLTIANKKFPGVHLRFHRDPAAPTVLCVPPAAKSQECVKLVGQVIQHHCGGQPFSYVLICTENVALKVPK